MERFLTFVHEMLNITGEKLLRYDTRCCNVRELWAEYATREMGEKRSAPEKLEMNRNSQGYICGFGIKEPTGLFHGRMPRIVAEGSDACFMKALGLMPTICLNCLEK